MRIKPHPDRRTAGHWPAQTGLVLLWLCSLLVAGPASLPPALHSWLQSQTNIQTWCAEVVQTRTLQTLVQPLQATGRVWFRAPDRFRWELGQPPRTIALRQAESLLVAYPRLKRAERYALGADSGGPWKETLALLEAGFPRGRKDLEARFRISSQTVSNGLFSLGLEPRSAAARRMMPSLKVVFSTNDWMLRATEITFTDGSTMRNDFNDPQLNPSFGPDLFEFDLPVDYEVTEPLSRQLLP